MICQESRPDVFSFVCNLFNGRGTWPVGLKLPNELGLYDMSGNVWEWTWDLWDSSAAFRVGRGGGYFARPLDTRVSLRDWDDPGQRDAFSGFRPARTPSP
jgi:formylglycine-generating enzyme required for sulfatase activity